MDGIMQGEGRRKRGKQPMLRIHTMLQRKRGMKKKNSIA